MTRKTTSEDTPPAGESAAIQRTLEMFEDRFRRTNSAGKLALRGQHAKSTGCVRAEFIVGDLPAELRVGIFKTSRTYPAWIRFSNGSEKVQADTKPDVRAMAIKLLDVPGEKVLSDERDATTQDFILANGRALFARNAIDMCEFAQRAAGGGLLGFFFGWNPFKWRLRELYNLLSSVLARVGNPLSIAYWSQTPCAFGDRAVKYKVVPRPGTAFAKVPRGSSHLRQAMSKQLVTGDVYFDFMVQFQRDPRKQPVEDAARPWNEKEAPLVKVATIRIPSQSFDTPQRDAFAEGLAYNPWHSLPEHRPLGGINRVRKAVYLSIAKLRRQHNGAPRKEPTVDDDPDKAVT